MANTRDHDRPVTLGDILNTIGLVIVAIVFIMPIFWAILMSLKTRADALAMPPKWLFVPTFEHYSTVWSEGALLEYTQNSLIVTLSATAIGLMLGVPAAYILARRHFRGKRTLLLGILSTRMIPPVAFIIPFFVIFTNLGLKDTYTALVIVYLTIILGFVIWMMRSYIVDLPIELEEAARIDGCEQWQTFRYVVLPSCKPGLATSAIFSFIYAWNEFLYAMVLTNRHAKTLPLGIYNWVSYEEVRWGELTAAAVLAMLPVLVFYLFVQRALVRGLTMGAVKG
ncbi:MULTISPECIES: carbohydrate ABC transporter permease [unclassified Chelatococcus]|uniref:carbohydrate ABC transporter permease n=1 Tax=unclassified Chelatococcus TaxID=2638111 RepID=UPI001BCBA098|nr:MULTISPECIES: carbohydrate ABC transporter permease [unclassified Chelatococcus]MBS7699891.1 carbohydrate ABC transporter permease [Chelatococcus sp. YT9]MBX3558763.1 carbohydrate ABC transporter permease [Chelatococcus sp.]